MRKVCVNFADSTYEALKTLAEQRGCAMGAVLRDAISLELWVEERTKKGAKLLIQEKGEVRQLELR